MKRSFALFWLIACAAAVVAAAVPQDNNDNYDEEDDEDTGTGFIHVGNHISVNNNHTLTLIAIAGNSTNSTQFIGGHNQRIVGGRQISVAEVPWQAAVIRETTFVCGASVIGSVWVLTAAHCVYGNVNKRYSVRAGTDRFKTGGQYRVVDRVAFHGGYTSRNTINDIALLRLRNPFTFSSRLKAIPLVSSYSRRATSYTISGWGTLSEDGENPTIRLRAVTVYPVDLQTCARAYKGRYTVNRNMLCASAQGRRQDSCQGDSGGALVSGGVQYGIVSFGEGCARLRYPGVYTNVASMRSWITATQQTLARPTYYG